MKKGIIEKIVCLIIIIFLFFGPLTISIESKIKNKEIFLNNNYEDTYEDHQLNDIKIINLKGGTSLSYTIINEGEIEYQNIQIKTRLMGNLILPPKVRNHKIELLSPGNQNNKKIINEKIFGLGKIQITIGLTKTGNEEIVIGQIEVLVIGPFIMILNSILNEENTFNGYTLFTPEYSKYTYLINNTGEVIHIWDCNNIQGIATFLLDDGNLIRSDCLKKPHPNFIIGGFTGHVGIYDPDGTVVWDFSYSNDQYCIHHDIELLPNGNILMIAEEYKSKEEAIRNGRNPQHILQGRICPDKIIEVKPIGIYDYEIVWEWHVWDHLIQDYDPTKDNYGDVNKHPELIDINFGTHTADWTHINSVDYNEKFDQILLCSRDFSEMWIIDHSTTTEESAGHSGGKYGKGGDLLYRWGNPQSYRAGDENDKKLFNPHDADWIESGCPGEGNILVFNNLRELENESNPSLRKYSSVDEIKPPVNIKGEYYKIGTAYGPQNPIWMYYDEENPHDFYSGVMSGAQRLPNGNTLICSGGKGEFFEVTYEKDIVWKYKNPYGLPNHVFNIYRYSKDHSGIKNLLGIDLN